MKTVTSLFKSFEFPENAIRNSTAESAGPPICKHHGTPLERIFLYTNKRTGVSYFGNWHCNQCKRDESDAAKIAYERVVKEDRIRSLFDRSGLQGRYLHTTFANFSAATDLQRKVLAECKRYAEELQPNSQSGLWLIGSFGTGKTHLGAAMVHHLIRERQMGACMLSARQLIRELRSTWQKESPVSEDELIKRYGAELTLLVLDEIGVGFGNESDQTQLFDVIDLRYQLQRPTVLLSNLPPAEISKVLGGRLFDRMREGSRVSVCDWISYR